MLLPSNWLFLFVAVVPSICPPAPMDPYLWSCCPAAWPLACASMQIIPPCVQEISWSLRNFSQLISPVYWAPAPAPYCHPWRCIWCLSCSSQHKPPQPPRPFQDIENTSLVQQPSSLGASFLLSHILVQACAVSALIFYHKQCFTALGFALSTGVWEETFQ